VLRGISDGASELTGISDWTRDLGIIDQKLARAIDLIEAQIATLL
jgi:adenosylhomocysteine nucleosidase